MKRVPTPPRRLPVAALLTLVLVACGPSDGLEPGPPEARTIADGVAELLLTGNDHGAFEAAKTGLEAFPTARELHAEYARAAVATDRPQLALDTWERMLASAEDEAARRDLWRSIAGQALASGLVQQAADAIAALRAVPDPSAYDRLLISLDAFERGELDRALDVARTGLDGAPNDALLAYQVARIELVLGRPDAEASLRRVIELDPGQDRAYFNLAQLALERGDDAAAEAALAKQTEVRELTRASFAALGPKARIRRAEEIAAALPTWSLPWVEIAQAQLELGQPRRAQETLDEARARSPFTARIVELAYAAARSRGEELEARKLLQRWRALVGQELAE